MGRGLACALAAWLLASSLPARAGVEPEAEPDFDGAPCLAQLRETARAWGAQGPWERTLPADDGSFVQRSPTGRIGVWVEARSAGERTRALRVSAHTTLEVSWTGLDCAPAIKTYHNHYDARRYKDSFTDEALSRLVARGDRGLIYVWSPQMELSMRGYAQAKAAAKRLEARLTVLLDPRADRAEAARLARKHGIPSSALRRMESLELFYRGVTRHYPALVVYGGGRIAGWADPGYQPAERYLRYARRRLASQ